jgi:hypothetical protein
VEFGRGHDPGPVAGEILHDSVPFLNAWKIVVALQTDSPLLFDYFYFDLDFQAAAKGAPADGSCSGSASPQLHFASIIVQKGTWGILTIKTTLGVVFLLNCSAFKV